MTTVDTRPPADALITEALCVMAFRSVLNGNRDLARARVARLSDDQRDELMSAAAILVAITGGVSEEALVAEAALSPDGIGGPGMNAPPYVVVTGDGVCAGCGDRMVRWRRRWAHRRCAATLTRHRAPFVTSSAPWFVTLGKPTVKP